MSNARPVIADEINSWGTALPAGDIARDILDALRSGVPEGAPLVIAEDGEIGWLEATDGRLSSDSNIAHNTAHGCVASDCVPLYRIREQ